jgi:hypothetical protein
MTVSRKTGWRPGSPGRRCLTGVAAFALAVSVLARGAALAGAPSVGAATTKCGAACVDLFSAISGTQGQPNLVIDSSDQGQVAGASILLLGASDTDRGEDFLTTPPTLVSVYFGAGVVSPAVAQHYGCVVGVSSTSCPAPDANDVAFELPYAPEGAASGLCMGVAACADLGEGVTLEPCGVSAKTIWIVDSSASIKSNFVPLINGSDTNFSTLFVLTDPTSPSVTGPQAEAPSPPSTQAMPPLPVPRRRR